MMIVGGILLVLGFVFPLLMVIKLVEATFWLSFLSHACSIVGMFLGFLGLFSYIRIERKK